MVILLVPPHRPEADSGIDLDNLARRVIPRVHSVLEPPSGGHIPDPATIENPPMRAYFEERCKVARRLPKHHVTRYEVVTLPRSAKDPPSGFARLVLCDGAEGRTFGQFVRETIESWDKRR